MKLSVINPNEEHLMKPELLKDETIRAKLRSVIESKEYKRLDPAVCEWSESDIEHLEDSANFIIEPLIPGRVFPNDFKEPEVNAPIENCDENDKTSDASSQLNSDNDGDADKQDIDGLEDDNTVDDEMLGMVAMIKDLQLFTSLNKEKKKVVVSDKKVKVDTKPGQQKSLDNFLKKK